jgi:uncharacterized membrane protein YphA (DoxX/SURF4 family)
MKIAALIARILLGIVFVVFGANGFLHFIPMPPMPITARVRTSLGGVNPGPPKT